MLEETSIDSPVKKRAKTISSNEHDLTLNHVAAFVEDTRRTGKLYVWYKAHQRLYDYLQTRRAKRLAHSSVDLSTPQANELDTCITENGDTHRNHLGVLLGRLETALEKHCPKTHDKNHPNAAKGPRSTTDSPPSHLPSSRYLPRSCSASRQALAQHPFLAQEQDHRECLGSQREQIGTSSSEKGQKLFPGAPTISNVTSEPMPEPEPLPLLGFKSKQSRASMKIFTIKETKAERLQECMKYFPKPPSPKPSPPGSPGSGGNC
ncbi:hypothetical protein B0T13DRAFT_486047 [Neurospora crassa]|nr:hypothetical protein B0T13DRAFT_486047 [Neurospora crassa]